MNTLRKHLTLRPHGNNLLTSSGEFWLISAGILVFAMAATEAIAWSYLGSLFSDGWTGNIIAAFMGCVVFCVIWIVDVSLITMDRSSVDHAHVLLEGHSTLRENKNKTALTFLFRTALLIGSLTITAPFLSQLVFRKDIENQITRDVITRIETARNTVIAVRDSSDAARRHEIAQKRSTFEREVAGQGQSGRYGIGPASEAISKAVDELEQERLRTNNALDRNLAELDALSGNWRMNRDVLAARFGLQLPGTSVSVNHSALNQLRKQGDIAETEFAIKGFLILIFSGLLMLKLFEPRSIRLYLSEVLQQQHLRFQVGVFDDLLAPGERSTNPAARMSPQLLYEFLANVWVPASRSESGNIESRVRRSAAKRSLEELDVLKRNIELEFNRANEEVKRLWAEADDAAKSVTELASAIDAVESDIEMFEREFEEAADNAALNKRARLELQSDLTRNLQDAKRAMRELQESVPSENETLDRARAALLIAELRLDVCRQELTQREKEIRESRSALAMAVKTDASDAIHRSA